MDNINAEIAEAQRRLTELIQLRDIVPNEDEKWLAERLHGSQCNWNHTDGCSWDYEIHNEVVDWSRYAHLQYLNKARAVLARIPAEVSIAQARQVIDAVL